MAEIDGIVVVDKPAGMTSHDVVYVARRLFRTKRVGHTGTLDPDATGILALCLGQATRLAEYLSAARKHYVAEVTFGLESDTQDASGRILVERDSSSLTESDVHALLPRFRGTIQQVPPMMSALHHEGQRLYELARAGITVERKAREIEIESLELTAFQPGAQPVATLEITCSTGTYIRTLAADLGAAAGMGALMHALRRTWVGESEAASFSLRDAHSLEALRQRAEKNTLADVVLPPGRALAAWPRAELTEALLRELRYGRKIHIEALSAELRWNWERAVIGAKVALMDERGNLAAVACREENALQPIKVFLASEGS